jgi:flagellar biosynthetic protein FliP
VKTPRQIWSWHWKAAVAAAVFGLIFALSLAAPALAASGPQGAQALQAAPATTPPPSPGASPSPTPAGTEAPGSTALPALINLPQDRASSVQILLLLTILSLAPSLLIMLTGFTRIIIVLGFVRNAIGIQQLPPNQVLIGLALFLTFFVMSPVIDRINKEAYEPYVKNEITQQQAMDRAMVPIREFMLRQTFNADLTLFANMAKIESVESTDELPTTVVIPAFITSEIKRAFWIGFIIFIPFIVIDMIVSSTLMSMGMMMLPPTAISLPFKILLFVLVDGWTLTIKALVTSFK